MTAKSDKGNASFKKSGTQKDVGATKPTAKPKKKAEEDDIDFEDDERVTKAGKKSPSVTGKDNDDNEIDNIEAEGSISTGEEDEENWDPDFDEFDLPKSSKKVPLGKKSAKDNEDEFKVDEEFEDFFNSRSSKKYNEDDDY